jgi:membrane protein DedA with SNARE-associated domain
MKLIEATIWSSVVFVALYALLSVSLRILELTETYYAHVAAGIVSTIISVTTFIVLIKKKRKQKK